VVFENSEDAKKAIDEYNGALLDDKVLTVEYDVQPFVKGEPRLRKQGKTLRVGGGRGAARRL
jgi:RNA recognition motif-containing protein